jgi:AbrB family looped-hinge helix DNA binding protein
MAKVDSKGRIVLPQEVRERLGITPGTEVEVREEDGKAVVEPEDDPEAIIERMEELVAGIPDERQRTPYDDLDPQAKDHVDTIRRQAEQADSEDDDR